RWGLRSSNEVLENEPGTHTESSLRIERMGHTRQFAEARTGELLQKVVSHLRKSKGHGAILALALFLLRFEPRHNSAVRDLLGEAHHSAPIVRAKAEGYGRQLLTKFCFRFPPRGIEEPLVPFNEE